MTTEEKIEELEKRIEELEKVISTNANIQNEINEKVQDDLKKIAKRFNTTMWW